MLRTISRMMSRAVAGLAAAGRSIEEPASILAARGGAGASACGTGWGSRAGKLLLTSKRNRVILLLDVYKRPGHSPGHARSDGVADARNHGAATRVRAGQTHPVDLRRRA